MQAKIQYNFTAKLWQHSSDGGWVFVSLPKNLSNEIREHLKWQEEGWGRMKAKASIKGFDWDTAIWFDKKMDTYLLPIKASVRNAKKIELNQIVDITIWL